MCGILAFYDESKKLTLKIKDTDAVKHGLGLLRHRGPDDFDVVSFGHGVLGHTRLSIVDPGHGHQPFTQDGLSWVHNGEIYNHEELIGHYQLDTSALKSHSDSAVIGPLYSKIGSKAFEVLDGVFAIVLFDERSEGKEAVVAARDPLGVKPLFYGFDSEGRIWFSSEIKGLMTECESIHTFPPGHYYTTKDGFVCYYRPEYRKAKTGYELTDESDIKTRLKETLVKATKKRLMSDVPLGSLLSGGLDSSLVAAIACEELKKEGKKLKTFSIGLDPQTDDLRCARKVAEHIGSEHHEVIFSVEEGLEALKHMVWTLETFDVTTIRASTPMYLMTKVIRDLGVKVVLSGEGADEIFGGYLYFGHAPSEKEFHDECLRRIGLLHTADLLRADRSTMGASVEARVPFLDKEFLEVSMAVHPKFKTYEGGRAEKWILRDAFREESEEKQLIPSEILWRQKEQFSDGVGYSWVDHLKLLAEKVVDPKRYAMKEELYPHHTPATKEAFMYREIYAELYTHGDAQKQVERWIPKWQDYDVDPSGRANKAHKATTSVSTRPVVSLAGKQAENLDLYALFSDFSVK